MTIEILYQDNDILVINKPPGVPTQGTPDPRRPHIWGLTEKQVGKKLFLHHRLDKDTSGVLLFGVHPEINGTLTQMFREHLFKKTYRALTKKSEKTFPLEGHEILNHLAPVRGPGKQLSRMVVVKSGGWKAVTWVQRVHEGHWADEWEARPQTGRTHQIRVHLAGQKTPILGDSLYGGKSTRVHRMMLHAWKLEFPHPRTQETLTVVAELPWKPENI